MPKIIIISLIIFAFTLIYTPDLTARQNDDLLYRKVRVTLVPGLSTNGINASQYNAKYSLNIIAGYHGGLEGYEVGIVNINRKFARGFQFGGLNLTGGDMAGLQIASLVNHAEHDISGLQLSGFANFAGAELGGLQLSGFANYAGTELSGLQAAGFMNYAGTNLDGLQAAGFMNYAGINTSGNISGLQASGFANIAGGSIEGLQAAGFAVIARKNSEGLQMSGFANIAGGQMEGVFLSGFSNITGSSFEGIAITGSANISARTMEGVMISGALNVAPRSAEGVMITGGLNYSDTMEGVQIAGLANIARKAEGVQIGFLNYAREFEGVPVGIISYYGNGRKNIDIWVTDGGFTHLGLKLGTRHIYNMVSAGYNPTITDRDVWALGWTFGVYDTLDEAWGNPRLSNYFHHSDFSVYHINDGEWTDEMNTRFTYRYMLGRELNRGFSIYGGPSLNLQISEVDGSSDYTWYSIVDGTRKGREIRAWIGFSLGFQVFGH
ncbi:MAG: hypothetical protein LC662_11055 [Rhodothermaceae bacterium]|nr:hypothetical protein [Rhodothermaceae bacterium]